MNLNDSIVSRFMENSGILPPPEEFGKIMEAFPEHVGLLMAFADSLFAKRKFNAAAGIYAKASRISIKSGLVLQAILAKQCEWKTSEPSQSELEAFHAAIGGTAKNSNPLNAFFAQMAFSEIFAFMNKLKRLRLSSGEVFINAGDEENAIFFVVSGILRRITGGKMEGQTEFKSDMISAIGANDWFGDIYPFEKHFYSPYKLEAATPVEVAEIEKSKLKNLCGQYPNIELLFRNLSDCKKSSTGKKILHTVRKARRYQIPTSVDLKIFHLGDRKELSSVKGITKDLSTAGACISLDENYLAGAVQVLVGRRIKAELVLPGDNLRITVLGTIVWAKNMLPTGKRGLEIGIEFDNLPSDTAELLRNYCQAGNGEQQLILSLWESLRKQ